ncbi:hypothetical protein BEL04_07295 [Mucilaginibacter sp. PPCGB 2223]|uniref:hypothetical protein n=1 Tax=Mucilaginibacter sp. PPCGB 2223 TaxID=1886027 RepID=UPI0008244329|nr:hypothetical protein [Mucilaginibacter sp. PPCGB 2223]OCX54070.1 hypothetical protein BEL04_07295 [Mucilaginibacter sp. PPCGB 2223]
MIDLFGEQAAALKNVIEAQQAVISSWEAVFGSVEDTVLSLVKQNLELKVRLLQEKDPTIKVPEDIYAGMDQLKDQYHQGRISALEYFEGLDTILTAIA